MGPSRQYIALGDSMSIDDYAGGPGRGAASLLFQNDDERFPEWEGRDLSSGETADELLLLARDGATSSDVVRQVALLSELDVHPVAITVSMGGNDLLAVFGNTGAARRAISDLSRNAEKVLSELRLLTGDGAPVVLATVYDPSDGSGNTTAIGLEPWPGVVHLIQELNRVLSLAASAHGAMVADIHQRFLGHGLSAGDPSQSQAAPADESLWYCNAVEPNAWGASQLRAAYWEAIAGRLGLTQSTIHTAD